MAVPAEFGGGWLDPIRSTRAVTELLRTLASGDAAVALVAAMHPGVLSFWLDAGDGSADWMKQRSAVFDTAMAGKQWGTMASEPGTGGDIAKTRTEALPAPVAVSLPGDGYRLSGQKHFASGSGITDYMVTIARSPGDPGPTLFAMDVSSNPMDGSAGLTITSEWDAMGMSATQSHGLLLENMPAVRTSWPGSVLDLAVVANPMITMYFCAVILGILDEAVASGRTMLDGRRNSMRSLERHEWLSAEREYWLAEAAYEWALSSLESSRSDIADTTHAVQRAKYSMAELAESVTRRLCRVIGGSAFSARSPFAHWHEDVRALGFLRPPWALAHDQLFDSSWSAG